ncbi:MAG: threonine synthase [Chloroflexota bacterium]
MGTVTWSSVLGADGTGQRVPGKITPAETQEGLVAYHYDYAPHLLPSGPFVGGMWRYRGLLPLTDGPVRYPLQVGGTPLVAPSRIGTELGIDRLWIKDETRSPSGSNKDRATALVLEHAMRSGAMTVSAASTGNVAVSLSIGAAAAGVAAVIFVSDTVDEGKLRLMLVAGAVVVKVKGGYEAAFDLSRVAARHFGWLDRNTGVNPVTLEGKKTVAFEIWEQLSRRLPDAVLVPVGDGTTYSALAKGFWELEACGVTDRLPRLIGVQAEGAQPIKVAFETRSEAVAGPCRTLADGIAVGRPISGAMAIRAAQETAGSFVAVTDEALLNSIQLLASRAGIIAEPAAAAAHAGLEAALELGLVRSDEEIVLLVTGSGLKTPQFLRPSGRVLAVPNNLAALEAALQSDSNF